MLRLPMRLPATVGVKTTVMVQLPLATRISAGLLRAGSMMAVEATEWHSVQFCANLAVPRTGSAAWLTAGQANAAARPSTGQKWRKLMATVFFVDDRGSGQL